MASKFLDDLKKAVEESEFNSEAARKIDDILKLSEEIKGKGTTPGMKAILDDIDKKEIIKPTEEEVSAANSDYEIKMTELKKQDIANSQLATLIEIEDLVNFSIKDMLSFVEELETKFEKQFTDEDPLFGELLLKIEDIKSKFRK